MIGMNCIIWNSDCAKVDNNNPKDKATKANKILTKITSIMLPNTFSFNSQTVDNTIIVVPGANGKVDKEYIDGIKEELKKQKHSN